ncbi:MAG: transposase [Planctomycetes bacterium]|nr:transposase [Planctomycetota bacterium]
MPRHPRLDEPLLWHHVMNRGIARRTLFESRRDVRAFLARLALAVRAGTIRVHAYCVLTTHFHLLVESPLGELSAVMQRLQNEYSRWFNRSRRRDGPLYRARFLSKPVTSEVYRRLLVRYIDANAVQAGLVARAEDYPYGSAQAYSRAAKPIWLERSWVESCVTGGLRCTEYPPARYPEVFPPAEPGSGWELIERRITHPHVLEDPLDDLLGGAGPAVLAWMERKAALADGTSIGIAVCEPANVEAVVEAEAATAGAWRLGNGHRTLDGWTLARVALLRELAGLTLAQAAERAGRSANGAWQLMERHRRLLAEDREYALRIAELADGALRLCHTPTLSPCGEAGVVGRAEVVGRAGVGPGSVKVCSGSVHSNRCSRASPSA